MKQGHVSYRCQRSSHQWTKPNCRTDGLPMSTSMVLSVDCGPDGTPEQVDDAAAGLREELLELDVDVESLTGGPAPAGAKGDAITAGALVVTLATSGTLTALLATLRAWINRDDSRSVKLRIGDHTLDVQGLHSDELEKVLNEWSHNRSAE
ncbi:hypothetical protein AB0H12_20460 [Actinosynnema sp. NPDC023794]